MNEDFLSSKKCSSLVIEIDWQEGARPRDKAVEALRQCAEKYCDKPDGITVALDEPLNVVDENGEPQEWPVDRKELHLFLYNIHKKTCNLRPEDETTAYLHVIYVRKGRNRGWTLWYMDGTALIVIFQEKIERHAFGLLTAAKLESLVLRHEFGHYLGLVRNPGHSTKTGHCVNPTCPMYSRMDFRSVLSNFIPGLFGCLPRDFCKECRADLERGRRGEPTEKP
jgi:hypothetical protein